MGSWRCTLVSGRSFVYYPSWKVKKKGPGERGREKKTNYGTLLPFREEAVSLISDQSVREWTRPRPDTSPGGGFLCVNSAPVHRSSCCLRHSHDTWSALLDQLLSSLVWSGLPGRSNGEGRAGTLDRLRRRKSRCFLFDRYQYMSRSGPGAHE